MQIPDTFGSYCYASQARTACEELRHAGLDKLQLPKLTTESFKVSDMPEFDTRCWLKFKGRRAERGQERLLDLDVELSPPMLPNIRQGL